MGGVGNQHLDVLERTFDELKRTLTAAGGKQEATDYADSIAAMREDIAAKDDVGLKVNANVSLDLVDDIGERVSGRPRQLSSSHHANK